MNTGKLLLLLLLTLFSSSLISTAQYKVQQPISKAQQDSLKKEIDIMVANDQKYRWMLMYGETDEQKLKEIRAMDEHSQSVRMQQARANKVGISKAAKDSLGNLQEQIDSLNFIQISGIIRSYGFPHFIDVYKVDLFFIHTPQWLNDDLLALLLKEVKEGRLPAENYAVIYDRVQMARGLPELYCIMDNYSTITKQTYHTVPQDLEVTNKARKEIGLKRLKK